MMTTTVFILSLALLALCGICFFVYRQLKQVEKTYQMALEESQRRLDQQSSRLNILTRALPNLQSLLSNPQQSVDIWKNLCLDEARALIWADGASYWRYIEKDQVLELDMARGDESVLIHQAKRLNLDQTDLGLAVIQRTPLLSLPDKGSSKNGSCLLVPLIVSGSLRGVFRFVRNETGPLNQRDLDLVSMFINHLSVTLENHDLVMNREKFYLELVQTFAETLDSRDTSSEGQSKQARKLARGVAEEFDMPNEFIYYLEFAALMHDVGKIVIDERLLKKPGKLTKEEFEVIKKHPEFGHKILASVTLLAPVAPMVLYHQEWFNGKGYPEGLRGEEIPLGARIVAILDAWGAMTSDRPWRKALSAEVAVDELKKGSGTQFDPQVVDAFITTLKKQGYLEKVEV